MVDGNSNIWRLEGETMHSLSEHLSVENEQLVFLVLDPLQQSVDCSDRTALGDERTKRGIEFKVGCNLIKKKKKKKMEKKREKKMSQSINHH